MKDHQKFISTKDELRAIAFATSSSDTGFEIQSNEPEMLDV